MATLTVYSDTADGSINSSNATYSTARSGGTFDVRTANTSDIVGQYTGYNISEIFWGFDTSSIGSSATVSSAALSGYLVADASTTDFTVNARLYDWGATVTSADWIAGASLSGNTLLAHLATTALGAGTGVTYDFVDDAFAANVNKTAFTRLVLASSRQEGNNTPTGNEYIQLGMGDQTGTNFDPKLVVTYATRVPRQSASNHQNPALV